jgi:hypothetical protein
MDTITQVKNEIAVEKEMLLASISMRIAEYQETESEEFMGGLEVGYHMGLDAWLYLKNYIDEKFKALGI